MEISNKRLVLQEHPSAMTSSVIREKYMVNNQLDGLFATSRSSDIRIDDQLQGIKTLTKITSKISTLNKTCFKCAIFNTVEENQNNV